MRYQFYTSDEIKPRGWLRRQLEIQAAGLAGNLDKIWPDVRDSAWIGGTAEGWERVPYWLDGFLPLAYLLEDRDMITRGKKYIDAILSHQSEDGWICPCSPEERKTYDTWAVLLIAKVLVVYYECSKDARIPEVVTRILKNFYDLLKSGEHALFQWGKYRWFEGFIAIRFVYERTPEKWLLELAELLKAQGQDYHTLTDEWKQPMNRWTLDTHIVNLVMALKYEAVSAELLGLPYADRAEELYQVLSAYNGTPVGLFTGDECLSGLSPIQGTELCSVVEEMYSFEHLYAATGDPKWAERLEVLAFNALPAAISDDMWTHQYVQQSNQIACKRFPGRSLFRTNTEEAHLFGLEPHFGCCTANFGQGWPKLTLSAFLHRENEILSALPIPSALNCPTANITLETDYPFKNSFRYRISAKEAFNFRIRIPRFAENLLVNGTESHENLLSFSLDKGEEREIQISFTATPHFEKRPYDLNTVQCGSLVFALPIAYEKKMYEYEKDGVERKFPYCDYEYLPQSAWNYGFSDTSLQANLHDISDIPFSSDHPPVTISAKLKKIAWGFEDGFDSACAKKPMSNISLDSQEEIELFPYGCAKLRMTELPFTK